MQNEVIKQQKQAAADLVKAKVAELNTAVLAAQDLGLEVDVYCNRRSDVRTQILERLPY
jgi:hypothetical protein